MRQMINGRLVDVNPEPDGSISSDALRQASGIPDSRPLILQQPDGANQLINPGDKVRVDPGQFFIDAPAHQRG